MTLFPRRAAPSRRPPRRSPRHQSAPRRLPPGAQAAARGPTRHRLTSSVGDVSRVRAAARLCAAEEVHGLRPQHAVEGAPFRPLQPGTRCAEKLAAGCGALLTRRWAARDKFPLRRSAWALCSLDCARTNTLTFEVPKAQWHTDTCQVPQRTCGLRHKSKKYR